VTSVNDLPTGAPTGTVVDGTEDTAQTILASTLLQGFSDVEGQTLSVSNISVDNGTLATTTGGWIFTPAANYNGPVTVTYTVSDGNGGTLADQTRNFSLSAVDDVPVANAASFSVAEDGTLTSSVTGSDVETVSPTYVLTTGPANGTLAFNADGTFTYTPTANYH
ncbi:cadherin-like domain-containing protein, partial [Asticcacaulis sp. AC402]|uniref:cadherin-like domain-containing protein n=1 Tax=Asticcacaulis sp. AC402 TaxID=1282361 RepID=UPI00058FB8AF